MLEALTRPLDADDLRGVEFDRDTPRLLEANGEESLHRLFRDNAWTDYLPIVLPTEERVEAMLAGTSHAPDEIVGQLRPTGFRELWDFTVEKVAVNAVMAGADAVLPPGDPRARVERHDGAAEQHVVDGQHGRRERPDPCTRSG